MLKITKRSLIILVFIFVLGTCIDPYTPKLKGYDSLLAVDALITDANTSYTVKLTRTMQNQYETPPEVADANVYLTDDDGNTSTFTNTGGGIYKSDSTEYQGTIGRTYVLHIATSDGKEYESDPCMMYPVPAIDSIYFEKDQQLTDNGTQSRDGISIYLDSKGGDNSRYYRWEYEETWKFKVPSPKKFNYIHTADPDNPIFLPVNNVKEFCWKSSKSDEILIKSFSDGLLQKIGKQPINFIATGESDRLLLQYSILVKQYSVSNIEYDFWNNLKQVNETGSDIFARQPYSVLSNLHSTTNPQERVLGYFQVSAVSEKRLNILYRDVATMGLPFYAYPCKTWVLDLSYLPPGCKNCPPPTWDDLYSHLSIQLDYTFTEPIYRMSDVLIDLVFTRPECADCELTGTSKKPGFWVDLN